MSYRESTNPKCYAHSRIQAAMWGKGLRGLWYQHCIICGAEAPWWKWMLVPFFGVLNDLPTGPGPLNTFDPRLSDRDLRALGFDEDRIKNRVRHFKWSPDWVRLASRL